MSAQLRTVGRSCRSRFHGWAKTMERIPALRNCRQVSARSSIKVERPRVFDVTGLVVMIAHGDHPDMWPYRVRKNGLQPVAHRFGFRPGGDYRHWCSPGQFAQHFDRPGHGQQTCSHRIMQDLEKN